MERIDDLIIDGLKIYQDDQLYKFTSDSVLLTRFTSVKKGDVVADFCSGSGIVGLHLYALNKQLVKEVCLFEMQKPLYDLSKKSVELNGLTDKFKAFNLRIQDIDATFNERFSLIVCNPPYMKKGAGETQEKETIAMCRSELFLPLEDLIRACSRCLKFGGRVNLCHRADRLVDLFSLMRKYNLEPKKLQTVSANGKEPYLVLVEGVKGGKSSLKVLKNIIN